MKYKSYKSEVQKFRNYYSKKGYELINITSLLETKLGNSGWCNGINEEIESCYHLQLHYRGEVVAHLDKKGLVVTDGYAIFFSKDILGDNFIIFRKVKRGC